MVLVAFFTLLSPVGKAPPWMDRSLAGYWVGIDNDRRPAAIYDGQRNFYLVRGAECDGAHVGVLLTRDRHIVANWGYQVPGLPEAGGGQALQRKPLSSLTTSRGIQIGDDEKTLTARLGKATKIERTGSRKQFRSHSYIWRNVKNGVGEIWTNEYVFKAGRLIEIRFARDMVPGC